MAKKAFAWGLGERNMKKAMLRAIIYKPITEKQEMAQLLV
jgi:L-rhamnose isomerase